MTDTDFVRGGAGPLAAGSRSGSWTRGKLTDPRAWPMRVGLASLVTALYGLACHLPAVDIGPNLFDSEQWGTAALIGGWLGLTVVPWLANPLLLAGGCCLLCKAFKAAFYLGLTATLLGLTTWVFLLDLFPPPFFHKLEGLLVGYYCWQASHVALTAGAGWLAWADGRTRRRAGIDH